MKEVGNLLERKRVARIGIPLLFCMLFFGLQSLLVKGEKGPNQPQVMNLDGIVLAQSSRPAVVPQVLYQRAWKLIKESYYDQKFGEKNSKEGGGAQDWNRWEHHYDGKLKTSDDAHKAIETMLASLGDPYTRFLDREAFDDEKSQIDAHLFGVGMQLGMHDHKVVVIAPIEDTPAFKAGVQTGDEIIEVDKKPVKGQSLDTVVKQIRGPIKTKVSITLMRKLEKKTVMLERAEIPIRAVASCEMLPGNIGYIRLDSFISSKANQEMKKALQKVSGADGIVLDLRYNPGGLLANAIEIANMFLDKGIIVSTIDADGYKTSQMSSSSPITHQPMIVLINGGSASASEILSGALRDNGRAKLVGQTSFGKGLVQAINKLEDGSGINVTIARYLTPNDTDIHRHGITPDYLVKLEDADIKNGKGPWWIDVNYSNLKKTPADNKDIQLNKAVEVIKDTIAKGAGKQTAQAGDTAKKN